MFCVTMTQLDDDSPSIDLHYATSLGEAVIACRNWARSKTGYKCLAEVWAGDYNHGNPIYWMTL